MLSNAYERPEDSVEGLSPPPLLLEKEVHNGGFLERDVHMCVAFFYLPSQSMGAH